MTMPRVPLLAPEGVRGQIHGSHSLENYDINEDGTVVVNHVDVSSLLNGGFQHMPRQPTTEQRDFAKAPISSVATGSHEIGATAIDPAKREEFHREYDGGTGQENHDFGDATPPHGTIEPGVSSQASRAQADMEVEAAEAAGIDASKPSHVADTGPMGRDNATAGDQAKAREQGDDSPKPTDMTDAAYEPFKDRSSSDEPRLGGKTKAERDEAGKAGGA